MLTLDGEVVNRFALAEDDAVIRLGIAEGKVNEINQDDVEWIKDDESQQHAGGSDRNDRAERSFSDLLAFL